MSRSSFTFSADASLQVVGFMHTKGIVHTLNDFDSGTLTLFISFDGGTTKEALIDSNGSVYSETTADQFKFDLPIDDPDGLGAILFATLAGSSGSPTLKVEILDTHR